jgi:hypothetical protein
LFFLWIVYFDFLIFHKFKHFFKILSFLDFFWFC